MNKQKILEWESFNTNTVETFTNLFKEQHIRFQISRYYNDGSVKNKQYEFKIEDFISKYYNLKNEYQKQSLILQQINKYRAKYKQEKEQLQKQFDYEDKYNKHNES